jgi:hypothetical protein
MSDREPYEGFYEDADRWESGARPAQPEHPIYAYMERADDFTARHPEHPEHVCDDSCPGWGVV